jgi:PAS domain S-box-containing protein
MGHIGMLCRLANVKMRLFGPDERDGNHAGTAARPQESAVKLPGWFQAGSTAAHGPDAEDGQPLRPTPRQLAAFFAAYVAGAWLGNWLMLVPGQSVTLWPPCGLYLATLLLSERRHWPLWLLAALPAEVAASMIWFGFSPSASLSIYLGNTLEALTGASLVRLCCGAPFRLQGLREVLALTLPGAILGPVLSAVLGALAISASGRQPFATAWLLWWLSDTASILVFAPLVLAAAEIAQKWRGASPKRWAEGLGMLGTVALVTHMIFLAGSPLSLPVMLPILWAALRFEIVGISLAMPVLTTISLRDTALGLGRFAESPFTAEEWRWLAQVFLIVVAFSALVVAALTRQRRLALLGLQRAHDELEARVAKRTADLNEAKQRLEAHMDNSPLAVIEFDRGFHVLRWSRGAERLFGWRAAEAIGHAVAELRWVHDEDVAAVDQIMADMLDGQRPRNSIVNRNYRKDGAVVLCEWYNSALYDAAGRLTSIFSLVLDITERQTAEAALKESELRYRRLYDSLRDAFVVVDMAGRIQEYNAPYREMLGYSDAELRRLTYPDLTPPQWHEREAWIVAEQILPKGSSDIYEKEYRRKDGTVFPVELRSYLVADDAGQPRQMWAIVRDISERKRAEAALRQSQEHLKWVLRATGVGLWMNEMPLGALNWDEETRRLFFIPATAEPTVELFYARLHPDDREPTRLAVEAAIQKGAFYEIDHRAVHPDTGAIRWIRSIGQVTFGADGQPARFDGINYDITERKLAEEALREADRRKDEFLAILAHELRNPLAPILNSLNVLGKAVGQTPATGRLLEMMQRQVGHLVRLVDDLLDVSRITQDKIELKTARVELGSLIGDAIEAARPFIDAGRHTLEARVPPEPLPLRADPVRVVQVLGNLLNNAAKYMEPGGRIEVVAERQGLDAVVSVRDQGLGIPADMLPRVFELFTQVDRNISRAQGGLGIGLALVRGLVELHGGRVEAHSEGPGRGSAFIVRLPLDLAPTAAAGPAMLAKAPGTARRILVVDDNQDAADSLGLLLETLGAAVRVVYDGPSALETVASFQPEVMLLDLGMPRMDGYETARRLRESPAGQDLLLIALTGWGQDEDRRRTKAAGFDHHLVKPVDFDSLQALLAGDGGSA